MGEYEYGRITHGNAAYYSFGCFVPALTIDDEQGQDHAQGN